jgi:hypothetical protein
MEPQTWAHGLSGSLSCSRLPGHLCEAQVRVASDTGRPPIPAEWIEPPDWTITIPTGSTREVLYYRQRFLVVFDDSTSGKTVRRFFTRYNASIVGGDPALNGYVIAVSDPGPSLQAVQAARNEMGAEPGIHILMMLAYRDRIDVRASRR